MSAARHQRVREVFQAVAELAPEQRAAALDHACGGDGELKNEVLALLAHDRDESEPLLAGASGPVGVLARELGAGTVASELPAGTRMGRYTVESLLGAGGMGAVYRARQDHPRRTVAIKLLRFDPANPGMRRRLELEAELLGRLSHPGVASVYEAGCATIGGAEAPYLAMELVEGVPITAYARVHAHDVRRRVGLMIEVCEAVSHAHQRGVIHRDLKPSNILVTAAGRPKVLDFGVARIATGADAAWGVGGAGAAGGEGLTTLPGQVVGTPGYMSPEQLDADPRGVGPQADVYALGVVLYQLLGGVLPHDPAGKSLGELRMAMKGPPRRLGELNTACRGDLEIIAAQALSAAPERRYRTVEALADDLRRWLEHRPITARRDSTLYVLAQMARRHKAATALGLALAFGLLVFSIVATSLALRNDRLAQNLLRSLYASRIGQAQAAIGSGDIVRARTLLDAQPPELRGWEWRHLSRRTDQTVRTIVVGASAVDLAFSPDSTLMALACSGAPARLVRAADGSVVWTAGEAKGHHSIAFSADGSMVIAKVHAGPGEVIETATGRVVQRISVPLEPPVAFGDPILRQLFMMPDNRTLIGYRSFGSTFRWTVGEAGERLAWDTGLREAGVGALSLDGRFLALSTGVRRAEELSIWDTASGERLAIHLHLPSIHRLAFTPDGSAIGMALNDGGVLLWRWRTGEPPLSLGTHEVATDAIASDHAGRAMGTGGRDGLIKLWPIAGGEPIVQVGAPASIRAVAFTHDDAFIAAAAADDQIRFWRTRPAPLLPSASISSDPLSCATVARDGASVLVGDRAGGVHRVDLATLERRPIGQVARGGCRGIVELADGTVVAGGERGELVRFPPSPGSEPRTLPVFTVQAMFPRAAPDGSFIAVRGTGKQLAIVDAAATRVEHLIELGDVRASAHDVSRHGVIAVGLQDGRVRFVRRDGAEAAPAVQLPDVANHIQFHPDGDKVLITGTRTGWSVRRVSDGSVIARPEDDAGSPRLAVFIDDDSRLVSIGNDRALRVWRWDTAEELCSLIGHAANPTAVAFNRADRSVISVDAGGNLRVWPDDDRAPAK